MVLTALSINGQVHIDDVTEELRSDGYMCPECKNQLVPVMGMIVTHHFRHKRIEHCYFGYGQTEWHLEMKKMFDRSCQEIRSNGRIADILLEYGTVVEFQVSSITADTITQRALAHDRIIWVFNVDKQMDNGQIEIDENGYVQYRRPKRIFKYCDHLFLYCNDLFFNIYKNSITFEYIENDETGYNEQWMFCNSKPYTRAGFVSHVIEYDNKFKPKLPPENYTQGSLFYLVPDVD